MPRRPDFSHHRPDPRFDRYRERVGRLFRDQAEVGWVLVEIEPCSEQVGGRLWWVRWDTTRDVLWLWTLVDGRFSDTLVTDEGVDDVLQDHDSGRFEYYGEVLRVVWTDDAESQRLRASRFGR